MFSAVGVLIVLAIPALLAGLLWLTDLHAERSAKAFCDRIEIGSNIALATRLADEAKIFYGDHSGYTFYFPGVMFNQAVCEVTVDSARKVTAKASEMERE